MLTRNGFAVASAALVFGALLPIGTARADGPVVGGDGGGTIGTGIYIGGLPGTGAPGGASGSGGGDGSASSGSGVSCSYSRAPHFDSYFPPPLWGYQYSCDDGQLGIVQVPVGTPPDAAPAPTPDQLAHRIYNELKLPKPVVHVNPSADEPGRFQVVNFPTWWWVTNFEPLAQRTALGAVWAEVTATPVFSTFDGGQGDSSRCNGAGIPWHPGLPGDFRAACTYTYRRAAEHVSATVAVTWKVTWVGSGGTAGTFDPLQMAAGLPLTVYERQAVNVPYGS